MRDRNRFRVFLPLVVLGFGALSGAAAQAGKAGEKDKAPVKCEMTFNLKGWSALYKKAEGTGTITCDNGESAEVAIRVRGGGLTVGKSEILEGRGTFSGVKSLAETLGAYAAGSAHASAVKGGEAAVYTKGEVSLALAGSGRGWDVGVDFGKFTISRKSS